MSTKKEKVRTLLDRHGETYAEEAGINLADKPMPLYQLLVLAMLLSARIRASTATQAATELYSAGLRTPQKMCDSTWRQRVAALGRGHYRRYDERTATMLGDGADLVRRRWGSDLRRLRDEGGDRTGITELLQEVPGIGPTGADIFCREVQGVWPVLAPFVDEKATQGARRLGLPTTPARLASYVEEDEMPHLVSGCVRAALSKAVTDDVLHG
ncbi:endonuclease III [Stackebrandtia endophytica]|uniref:Endonuclease III n=1 Tax=Stackebrandtia endophytica TaxID=1496996 RepID=A0A543B2B5_9ACTN|nr:endonuclease [Stackebrandtia endophytica]TQL78978.1 endonuclease III [Stackebrandtia endophytica]